MENSTLFEVKREPFLLYDSMRRRVVRRVAEMSEADAAAGSEYLARSFCAHLQYRKENGASEAEVRIRRYTVKR